MESAKLISSDAPFKEGCALVEQRSFVQQLAMLKPCLKPHRLPLTGVLFAILIAAACNILSARYLGLTLDMAISKDWDKFMQAFIWLVAVWLISFAVMHIHFILANNTAERVTFGLRQDIAEKLGTAAGEELERKHSGDYISRLSNDTDLISGLVSTQWAGVVSSIVGAAAALVYMLLVSWRVTLISLALTPLFIVVSGILSKPLGKLRKEYLEKLADVNALAQDVTGGITVSKAFLLKNYLSRRFRTRAAGAASAAVNLAFYSGLLQAIMIALSISPFFVLFGAGGFEVIEGRMTVGSLVIMMNLFNNLTSPLQTLGISLAEIRAALAASGRIFELLELPSERADGRPLLRPADYPYALEMKHVRFSYGQDRLVFSDLNLAVRQGETVGIVGPSGSGKSTLFSLLLGLREPQAGEILYYGQPMRDISLSEIRRAIAYVAQDALLFPVSILENIGYGREEATRAEIEAAAHESHSGSFIEHLPGGYDTRLGESGTGLSGGQKQRLSLARAILKDAPILFLDEATSALDTEAEAIVQAAIERLAGNRTILIIAHRLSALIGVDRIVVIDQGTVAEEGTHEELLAANKTYAALYAAQLDDQRAAAPVAV